MKKDKIHRFKGRGKDPKEAFASCFETMLKSECLNLVKLNNGDWMVGFKSILPEPEEKEIWEKNTKRIYDD